MGEAFNETDPRKSYVRGFTLQSVSPLPITYAEHISAEGHWGRARRDYMRDYVHRAVLGALCDFLPQADNRVTLADEKDVHGLPVARLDYSQCDNDRALMTAAQKTLVEVLEAAGATQTLAVARYAHLAGGARMAASAAEGVVDAEGRTFAIPNRMLGRQRPWTAP